MVKKTRGRFVYKPREKDAVKKRANQSGGLFDSLFKSQFAVFTPKEGDYRLRMLPPTWNDAQHFGLDIYVHYSIGSDNQSYLCLDKMLGEKCPVCEQRKVAERGGDPDYAKSLTATKRVLVWCVDRSNEEGGPQLWSMAWTIDRDLANLSIDKASGELLLIDDPEEGYDIEFTRTGKGLKTKYSGTAVARRSSPLCDEERTADEWLGFVAENPLPDVLQYFDYEHIAAVASGAKKDADEDEEEAPTRSKARAKPAREEEEDEDDEEDASPTKTRTAARSDDDEDAEPDCPACQDTGKNSRGGFCVCKLGKKLKSMEEEDDEDERASTRRRVR